MTRRIRRTGLTPLAWLLLFALLGAVAVCGVRTAGAQEATDEVPRYVPSARGGRAGATELVAAAFPPEWASWALTTSWCESRWDPYAYSAGFDRRWGVWYEHVGLLQVDGVTWRRAAREIVGGDFLDPAVNVAMAAWIVTTYGPQHWPYCGRSA